MAQKRQLALLAYLATAGARGRSRDRIHALLWPERSATSARHSLADAIYRVRKALGGDALATDRDTVRLGPVRIQSDVCEFEALLDQGDLEEAVALYHGPFLDGFHLQGSREFDEWRGAEAQRLGRRFEEALETLATRAESEGDGRRTADFWGRLSLHDPLNTRYVLGRMRALAAIGCVGNAIKLGEGHTDLLLEELGADPPLGLTMLLASLRAGARTGSATERSKIQGLWGDPRPGIAVLPCENLSARPEDSHYADLLHDAIITRLQMASGIVPTGRSSVLWYRNHPAPTVRIGQELNVAYLGESSVCKEQDRIQVNFRLLEARSGRQIWAGVFETSISQTDSIMSMLSDIAQRVVRGIGARLTTAEQARIASRPTGNLTAYELYMIGRNRVGRYSRDALLEAMDFFRAALERDPSFGLAYAGLAEAMALLPIYDVTIKPPQLKEQAWAAVSSARRLNPTEGEVHSTYALYLHFFEWDWAAAEREYRQGLDMEPGDAMARVYFSSLLAGLGRVEEGAEETVKVLAMEPRSSGVLWASGNRLWQAGRVEEARALFERAVRLEPAVPWAFNHLAFSYARDHPTHPARCRERLMEFAAQFGYPYPERMTAVADALGGRSGLRTEAMRVLDDVVRTTALDRPHLVYEYAALAPDDVLFEFLEEAVDTGHVWVPWIPISVTAARPDVWEDPRWQDFLSKIRHPWMEG